MEQIMTCFRLLVTGQFMGMVKRHAVQKKESRRTQEENLILPRHQQGYELGIVAMFQINFGPMDSYE